MKQNSNRELTPKLRFPEFRGDGAWRVRPLVDLGDRIVERVGDALLTPVSITAGRGFVSQAEKFGRDISGVQYKNYYYLRRGDFAYNKGNSNKYPQGCVYRLKEFDEAAASNAFICFRLRQEFVPGFFEALFEKNTHGRQLTKFLTSGARSDGLLNINPDEFFSIGLPVPNQQAEQRIIAYCLSSLDDVIGAQARQVRALKAHKKALMQQLFPREGETLPRLRFPAFRDTPEWTKKQIGDICEVLNNRRVPISSADRRAGPYPYYGASGVVDFVEDHIFDERLLLVGEDGAKWGTFEKTAFIAEGKYWVNNHAHVLKTVGVNDTFLENYLNMSDIRRYVTGNAPPKLTLAKLKSITVSVPESLDEQHSIAGTLSSSDDLIAAQSQKLGALKAHKIGLMQQLFPSPEEVDA